MSELHVPQTGSGGTFLGERGGGGWAQTTAVLDGGTPTPLPPGCAVDHDRRLLRAQAAETRVASPLQPQAIQLEATAERRRQRWPVAMLTGGDGGIVFQTTWQYFAGPEARVTPRDSEPNVRIIRERLTHYDGSETTRVLREDVQPVTVTDFDWAFYLQRQETTRLPTNSPEGWRYRTQIPTRYELNGSVFEETVIQAHLQHVWLPGEWTTGQGTLLDQRYTEVTRVHGSQTIENDEGTLVDAWMRLARLVRFSHAGPPPNPTGLTAELDAGGWVLRYLDRTVAGWGAVLRDTEMPAWPGMPEPDDLRFTAADGRVQVRGPRTFSSQLLEYGGGKPTATLTAFGHEFRGGSWAALRDAPLRDEQGNVTDWNRVLVLHASADTVTAVWQDGKTDSIPREQFEREVLRVGPGEFQGFSAVGTLFNTWPHDWAWCNCKNDARAVTLHEAWRDSQVRKPAPDAQPPPGPDHWYWKARPKKRPRKLPAAAPVAPLRLTLADVTGVVLQDELLKRGEGPLLLPETATVQRDGVVVDVRAKVAKRIYYPPARWEEELDDRTSVTGTLTLTYKLPDPPRPPQGDDPGEDWGAALVLRLKTTKTEITVNGEELPLGKLGHNADEPRGWHPYVVPVPVADAYTLQLPGPCSRALLCVRKWPKPGESQAE